MTEKKVFDMNKLFAILICKGPFFYHPRLPNCLGQMLTARAFSQNFVLSTKTIRPDIPLGV